MSAVMMDGKALAAKVKEGVRNQVEAFRSRPGLAVCWWGTTPPPGCM